MVFFLNRIDFYSIEIIGRVLTRKRRKEGRKERASTFTSMLLFFSFSYFVVP